MSDLLRRVLEHEGFREKPYQDTLGIWTFGHGLTYITEDESRAIVAARLHDLQYRLVEEHPWLSGDVLEAMTEMCFQLGWNGCHNFKKMWDALMLGRNDTAANEMLDSRWAKQTPARAQELAAIVRAA